jgi:hypothetical protein
VLYPRLNASPFMLARSVTICGCLFLVSTRLAECQTLLKLSTIIPGTEQVQLVDNGDFQFLGPLVSGAHPSPSSWTRQADMFTGAGANTVPADRAVVALAHVDGGAPVGMYSRGISLRPNTDYVLSAYLAGCKMIYGAMFEEIDEGTAMLKLAPTHNELPVQGTFVPLNIDGQELPSDWYLRLADQASRMLRGDIPRQATMPITP